MSATSIGQLNTTIIAVVNGFLTTNNANSASVHFRSSDLFLNGSLGSTRGVGDFETVSFGFKASGGGCSVFDFSEYTLVIVITVLALYLTGRIPK